MEEIIFTPDYGKSNVIAKILLSLLGILLFLSGYNANSTEIMVGGGFCFLVVVFALIAYPRSIIFSQSQVIIKRHILPDQVFEYRDFTDIGGTAIRFGRKGISLLNMKNGNELVSIFQKLIEERRIQPTQFEGRLLFEEAWTRKAMLLAIVPSIILNYLLDQILVKVNLEVDDRIVWLVSYLISLFAIYLFLKRRHEAQQ